MDERIWAIICGSAIAIAAIGFFAVYLGDASSAAQIVGIIAGGIFGVAGTSRIGRKIDPGGK
jgi:putative Ca2+/H+ antiporter (TMEM165/GDT1 family)